MSIENQKYLSRRLKFITSAWCSFPLTFLFLCLGIFDTGMSGVAKTLLSPWYWFVATIAVWAGQSVRNLKWYSWYAFLFSNLLVLYETAWVLAYFSFSQFKTVTFICLALLQMMIIYIVGIEIRVPYFSPRIRWWESDPRYKFSLQVKIEQDSMPILNSEIIDISRGGCFIKTNHAFSRDTLIGLDFIVFERQVCCKGQVVWNTESTVTHPKGIGVRFVNLDRDTSYCLKQASIKLKKLARVYKELIREKNWQDYLEREKQFQSRINPSYKSIAQSSKDESSDETGS